MNFKVGNFVSCHNHNNEIISYGIIISLVGNFSCVKCLEVIEAAQIIGFEYCFSYKFIKPINDVKIINRLKKVLIFS